MDEIKNGWEKYQEKILYQLNSMEGQLKKLTDKVEEFSINSVTLVKSDVCSEYREKMDERLSLIEKVQAKFIGIGLVTVVVVGAVGAAVGAIIEKIIK